VKQGKFFSREELTTFFEMPTTFDNLLDKAYAAVALSFAARGAKVTTIMWEEFTQSVNSKGKETTINIPFQMTKVSGVPEKMLALITVQLLEGKAIMEYATCFSDDQQRGRYFRKLSATRGGVGITNTKMNVGHNTLAKAALLKSAVYMYFRYTRSIFHCPLIHSCHVCISNLTFTCHGLEYL
jgi:hypothetical protein